MSPTGILIISDDIEFARALTARWQSENISFTLTLASSDVWSGSGSAAYELIIVGPVRKGRLTAVLHSLGRSPAPCIYVTDDANAVRTLQAAHPRLLVIPQREGWPDSLLQVAREVLRRMDAVSRARRAERFAATSERFATLGRFMLEMRPSVNNALTSVLGNADLVLSDREKFPAGSREQIEAIHSMSLRLKEIMVRFSSLASEMELAEKQSQSETELGARALAPEL